MDDKSQTPENAPDPPVRDRAFDTFHHPGFEIPIDFDELPEEDMRYWRAEGDEDDQPTKSPTDGSLDEPLTD